MIMKTVKILLYQKILYCRMNSHKIIITRNLHCPHLQKKKTIMIITFHGLSNKY